jgi:hypothetical protein
MIKKKIYVKIYLIIYFFIAIYAPPFSSLNILFLLMIHSLISIVFQHRNRVIGILERSGIITFILIIAIMLLMQFSSYLRTNIIGVRYPEIQSIYLFYQTFVLMISMFVVITYILCTLDKYDISHIELLNILVFAGLIQSGLSFLAYFFPSIRFAFLNIIGNNSGLSSLYSNYSSYLSYRGYGFSINLLDAFGFGTGLLGGISFILGNKNKKYYLATLFLTLTTLLNSRTGLIVIALSIFIWIFNGKNTFLTINKVFRLFISTIILFISYLILLPKVLLVVFNSTKDQIIKNTSRDLLAVINFDYKTLSSELWILPESTTTLMLGDGISVNTTLTTIGFVNSIWAFGILGSILIYFIFTYIVVKAIRLNKDDSVSFMINIMMLLVFYIIQLKMPVFTYNAGTFIMYFYIVYSIFNKKKNISLSNKSFKKTK